jgi:type III secretory pathway component EscS
MLKKALLLLLFLILLAPVCGFVGYALGHLIAIFKFSATLQPDTYQHDRELFAGIIGIMFIGGFLYLVTVGFAVFRFLRSVVRTGK